MAADGGFICGVVCSEVEDTEDQGCLGEDDWVFGIALVDHFASHSIILCGKLEGGKCGSFECNLSCGGPINKEFETAQARIIWVEGCGI